MNDELNVLDELAYAVQNTLGYYRELIKEGRYTDARECLAMTEELTNQIHAIEDHTPPVNYFGVSMTVDSPAEDATL